MERPAHNLAPALDRAVRHNRPASCEILQRARMAGQGLASWGKKWGKKPHRSQPIPADLELAKTA
jgi:hypothetical protein